MNSMAPFLLDVAPARSGSEPLVVVAVVLIVMALVAVVAVATGIFVFVRVRQSRAGARAIDASWASGQFNSPSEPGAEPPNPQERPSSNPLCRQTHYVRLSIDLPGQSGVRKSSFC